MRGNRSSLRSQPLPSAVASLQCVEIAAEINADISKDISADINSVNNSDINSVKESSPKA